MLFIFEPTENYQPARSLAGNSMKKAALTFLRVFGTPGSQARFILWFRRRFWKSEAGSR